MSDQDADDLVRTSDSDVEPDEPGAAASYDPVADYEVHDTVADDEVHDADVDAELERLDDGGTLVGSAATASGPRSDALPFVMSSREHFASVGDVELTGEARVDAATARLEEIPDLPTPDHVAVYDDVHHRLQDALSDADVR